jgi:hypothetical protein
MSIVCHYFKSTLQSYKIVVNNEQKARKTTSLREVKKTLKRTSPTSAVKLADFSAELWQLLWSSLGACRVAGFYACSPFGQVNEWG